MPTLRQLDYLVALADTLHFRRAAQKANTTQSTLSLQLKALEERLGTELVERRTTGVVVTPAGQEIVSIARRMLQDAQRIRDLAKRDHDALKGIVRLGLPPSIGPSLLARVIPAIRERFPDLKLYVREELPHVLSEQMEKGQHDLIIVPDFVARGSIVKTHLFCEPVYLALPPGHPLCAKDKITLDDLRDADILALERGHPLHEFADSLCAKAGARLRQDFAGTSIDMLHEMTATGLGLTFLPGLFVRTRLVSDKSVVIRTIHGEKMHRAIVLAWREGATIAPKYLQFGHTIREEISRTLPDFADEVTALSPI